jgi:hypothetical protein
MSSAPAADASSGPAYQEVWQTRRTVIEDNVIELTPSLPNPPHAGAAGILLVDYLYSTTFPRFVDLVIRGNVIRELNDSPDSNTWGISLYNCSGGIVEDNVIDPKIGNSLKQDKSSGMQYFNNRTPEGSLLQGLDGPANEKIDELTTRIEDGAVLAF